MRVFLFLILFSFTARAIVDLPDDAAVLERTQKKIDFASDNIKRDARRLGNRTIEIEIFVSADGRFEYAPQILSDFAEYNRWLLPGVNTNPEGGDYYFQVIALDLLTPDRMKGHFHFHFPLFKKDLMREFKVAAIKSKTSLTLTAETYEEAESIVQSATGYMKVLPDQNHPERLWMAVNAKITLSNTFNGKLLYNLLPEKVLLRESGERIRTILENYRAEEARVKQKPNAKLNQSPIEKTAK